MEDGNRQVNIEWNASILEEMKPVSWQTLVDKETGTLGCIAIICFMYFSLEVINKKLVREDSLAMNMSSLNIVLYLSHCTCSKYLGTNSITKQGLVDER